MCAGASTPSITRGHWAASKEQTITTHSCSSPQAQQRCRGGGLGGGRRGPAGAAACCSAANHTPAFQQSIQPQLRNCLAAPAQSLITSRFTDKPLPQAPSGSTSKSSVLTKHRLPKQAIYAERQPRLAVTAANHPSPHTALTKALRKQPNAHAHTESAARHVSCATNIPSFLLLSMSALPRPTPPQQHTPELKWNKRARL